MDLDENITIHRLETLEHTAAAELKGDSIVGHPAKVPFRVKSRKRLCEEVMNLSDSPIEILRFTRKYGPLMTEKSDAEGNAFEFRLTSWRGQRDIFRKRWTSFAETER